MRVICKACGRKIDRDTAFKIAVKNKNQYYCSIDEYKNYNKKLQQQKKIKSSINTIFPNTTNWQVVYGELKKLKEKFTEDVLLEYLDENKNKLKQLYGDLDTNENEKVRYIFVTMAYELKMSSKDIFERLDVKKNNIMGLYKYNNFGDNVLGKPININMLDAIQYQYCQDLSYWKSYPDIFILHGVCGVYEFTLCGETVYVGSSMDMLNRLESHIGKWKSIEHIDCESISDKKYYYFDKYISDVKFNILAIYNDNPTRQELMLREYSYINLLCPIFNSRYGGFTNKWYGTDDNLEKFVHGILTIDDLKGKLLYSTQEEFITQQND